MRSILRLFVIAAVVASALSLTLSSTVFAASYRPDARIRLSAVSFPPPSSCGPTQHFNNPWTGDDVFNKSGKHQNVKDDQYSGGDCFVTFQFQISIQNAGTTSDRFMVHATGPAVSPDSWKVTYLKGSTNVTSKVVDGTYRTATLAKGADEIIVAKAAYLGGQDLSRLVTATSLGGGAKDAVKFQIVENSCC